jgi:hypothetical protein
MLQSRYRQALLQMSNFGLLAGVMLWVILVVRGAQQLRNASHLADYLVQFGPLKLTHIVKQPIEDGFSVSFSLEPGLVWYVFGWVALGLLGGIAVVFVAKRSQAVG